MTRREKLRQRVEQAPKQVRFEDLDRLLRAYGFEVRPPRGGGSHYFYTRGRYQISVPYRRPHVLVAYVRRVLKLIDQAEEESEDEDENCGGVSETSLPG